MADNGSGKRRKNPHWVALGFVCAFLLSTATIIFTGLQVGAPRRDAPDQSAANPDASASEPALVSDRLLPEDEAEPQESSSDSTANHSEP